MRQGAPFGAPERHGQPQTKKPRCHQRGFSFEVYMHNTKYVTEG
jgi:hypothetical protein